jgi:hypothetical protein
MVKDAANAMQGVGLVSGKNTFTSGMTPDYSKGRSSRQQG